MTNNKLENIINKYRRFIVEQVELARNRERSNDLIGAIKAYEKALRAIDIVKNYVDKKTLQDLELTESIIRKKTMQLKKRIHKMSKSVIDEDIELIKSLVVIEKPNISMNDLADLEEAKIAIIEAISYPTWRAILLYGPPGTGKTSLAKAVAHDLDITFIYADFPILTSKWVGESEKNISRLFKLARTYAPSIVFFDELDYLGEKTDSSGVVLRMVRVLQAEMEGLRTRNDDIVIIGATNYPWVLNPALLSRFRKRIYIPLPNKEVRKIILEKIAKRLGIVFSDDVDLDRIAELTERFSGRDLENLLMEARLQKIRKTILTLLNEGEKLSKIIEIVRNKYTSNTLISMQDLIKALEKTEPSVTNEYLNKLENWRKEIERT